MQALNEPFGSTRPGAGKSEKPKKVDGHGRGRARGRGEIQSPGRRVRGRGRGTTAPGTPVAPRTPAPAAPATPAPAPATPQSAAPGTPMPRRPQVDRRGKDDSDKIEKHLANCNWLQILLKKKTKADLYQARRCQKDLEKHTRLDEATKFDEPLAVGSAAAALLDIAKTPWEQVQVTCSLLQHSPFEH